MKLYREDGKEAGLYDICQHLIDHYPEDIFVSTSGHPVHIMRDMAKEVLEIRDEKRLHSDVECNLHGRGGE